MCIRECVIVGEFVGECDGDAVINYVGIIKMSPSSYPLNVTYLWISE